MLLYYALYRTAASGIARQLDKNYPLLFPDVIHGGLVIIKFECGIGGFEIAARIALLGRFLHCLFIDHSVGDGDACNKCGDCGNEYDILDSPEGVLCITYADDAGAYHEKANNYAADFGNEPVRLFLALLEEFGFVELALSADAGNEDVKAEADDEYIKEEALAADNSQLEG